MYVCMYACMHACMHACMFDTCMHACMQVCPNICAFIYIHKGHLPGGVWQTRPDAESEFLKSHSLSDAEC